jgi:hypothetical protein
VAASDGELVLNLQPLHVVFVAVVTRADSTYAFNFASVFASVFHFCESLHHVQFTW